MLVLSTLPIIQQLFTTIPCSLCPCLPTSDSHPTSRTPLPKTDCDDGANVLGGYGASNAFALTHCNTVVQVKDRLFPMGLAARWRSGEAARLMGRPKENIKVHNERVYVVIGL